MQSRRRNLIRAKVESLLNESSITKPVVNVEAIARKHGIQVLEQPFDEVELSGFLARRPGSSAVIGINANQSPGRRRFTMAHELGHYFLHGGQGHEEVHVDHTKDLQIKLRSPASSTGTDEEEVEANLFAAELLMPLRFLEEDFAAGDVSDEGAVAKLAKRYGVSPQAMSIRLGNLGLNIV